MNEQNEQDRITELGKYKILDTLTEKDYEDVTYLASIICNVPIALISFVDNDRQWFKSHQGLNIEETKREHSFCAHAIENPSEIMMVADSRKDERFKNNPLVTGDPNIVFYAGVPLVNKDGFGLGTVCVIDTEARKLTDEQINALKILAAQVMNLLEMRKKNKELELLKAKLEIKNNDLEQFAMVVSHDIKTPLTGVLVASQLLLEDDHGLRDEAKKLVSVSFKSAQKIESLVDGILANLKDRHINPPHTIIELKSFFSNLEQNNYSAKVIRIHYNLALDTIQFNRTQLEQVFINLFTNSSRYNVNEKVEISVTLELNSGYYQFSIRDNGIGIAAENHEKIFQLFNTLADSDSTGSRNSGIGLSTVKKIIESSGGWITLESALNKGTTIHFTLPVPDEFNEE